MPLYRKMRTKISPAERMITDLDLVVQFPATLAGVGTFGTRIGIKGLSAHDCRHAWVEAAVRGKMNLKALQDADGWTSPVMPLRYAWSAEIANEGVVLA